jgi:hypothetical protein
MRQSHNSSQLNPLVDKVIHNILMNLSMVVVVVQPILAVISIGKNIQFATTLVVSVVETKVELNPRVGKPTGHIAIFHNPSTLL